MIFKIHARIGIVKNIARLIDNADTRIGKHYVDGMQKAAANACEKPFYVLGFLAHLMNAHIHGLTVNNIRERAVTDEQSHNNQQQHSFMYFGLQFHIICLFYSLFRVSFLFCFRFLRVFGEGF